MSTADPVKLLKFAKKLRRLKVITKSEIWKPKNQLFCDYKAITYLRLNSYSHWTSLTRCQTIGAACSYFMNVWSLETSASSLTAIEVIPVLPECLRSFLTKYKQDKTTTIILAFMWRASSTNLCLHVLLFDQVTISITDSLTPWMCGQEPFARLTLSV